MTTLNGQAQRRKIFNEVASIVDEYEKLEPSAIISIISFKLGLSSAKSREYYEELKTLRKLGIFPGNFSELIQE